MHPKMYAVVPMFWSRDLFYGCDQFHFSLSIAQVIIKKKVSALLHHPTCVLVHPYLNAM